MSQTHATRRTLLPLLLLLGGLLGTGPFVPRTFGAATQPAVPGPLEVPGLAGWLGLLLAVVALALVVIARRGEQDARSAEATRDVATDSIDPIGRRVDPLVAALRGHAAYAPDDLEARLTASTSSTGAHPVRPESEPLWTRRIAPRRGRHDGGPGWNEQPTDDVRVEPLGDAAIR